MVCLSELGVGEVARLAERHGNFGLAFHRSSVQLRGAAPVWYLPRDSLMQTRFFDTVKKLAFRNDPVRDEFLWELTPFVDYPRDANGCGTESAYDWRWEREWRIRGDLEFGPTEVAIVFAPSGMHHTVSRLICEVLRSSTGTVPPIVDPRWPRNRQLEVIRGATLQRSDGHAGLLPKRSVEERAVPPVGESELLDTAPRPVTWIEDDVIERSDQEQEWTAWLEVMERDDI